MKKNYIIIIVIFILIILSCVLFWNYTLQKKRESEFNNIVETVKTLDDSIKDELKKINSKEEVIKEEDFNNKLDKINDIADKTKKENEDILSSDILKSGTSTGAKYSGEACMDVCW